MTVAEWFDAIENGVRDLSKDIEIIRQDDASRIFIRGEKTFAVRAHTASTATFMLLERRGGPVTARLEDQVTRLEPRGVSIDELSVGGIVAAIAAALNR